MSVLDGVRVVIYRFHEKGLEIFLLNNDLESDPDVWRLPQGVARQLTVDNDEAIALDAGADNDSHSIRTMAVEGDWHDIPSIRGMLRHDVRLVKSKIKEVVPHTEKGAYFAFKEAVKKMMPEEYRALKELKDILVDRNSTKYI